MSQRGKTELERQTYELYYGQEISYTWDDFYQKMREEKAAGMAGCPQASYMALQLLRNRIFSIRIDNDSEGYEDLYQDVYLEIMNQISRYDANFSETNKTFENRQASFATYMSKWIDGLASSIRGGGISFYDRNVRGVSVTSSDAIAEKKNDNGDAQGFEVRDESSEVEKMLKDKERNTSNTILKRLFPLEQYVQEDGSFKHKAAKKDLYRETTYLQLLFGGYPNLPEEWKDELVELVR